MNFWLTKKGVVRCSHRGPLGGRVSVHVTQRFVRIAGGAVNIASNTLNCSINDLSCSIITDVTKGIFACKKTITVDGGYSKFITIEGKAVCLDHITGKTLSNPAGGMYNVRNPGQRFVKGE